MNRNADGALGRLFKRALLACLFVPTLAAAWGAEGHRLIAELAYERLPAPTRDRVQALLALEPGATLPSIATWADEVRSPSTAAWHYTNFDGSSACRYEEEQSCPDGQCVVGALDRQARVLATAKTTEDQLKALKWVVHLVGDVHQPLHAGITGDKGGNLYQVQAFGRGTNLHSVWDGVLIRNWPGGSQALREAVVTAIPKPRELLSSQQWAEESCKIVSAPDFYPDGRFITEEYQQRWAPVTASRMAAAADRLAKVLTKALP